MDLHDKLLYAHQFGQLELFHDSHHIWKFQYGKLVAKIKYKTLLNFKTTLIIGNLIILIIVI